MKVVIQNIFPLEKNGPVSFAKLKAIQTFKKQKDENPEDNEAQGKQPYKRSIQTEETKVSQSKTLYSLVLVRFSELKSIVRQNG